MKEKITKEKKKSKSFLFFLILILILIAVVSYIFWEYISPYWTHMCLSIERALVKVPILYAIYMFFKNNIISLTPTGMFFIMFFSSFFFVPLPLDLFFIDFLIRGNINPFWIIIISAVSSTIGLFMNYLVGFPLGEKFVKKIIQEKMFEKFKAIINKAGSFLLVAAIFIPVLPAQLLSVLYGFSKFSIKKFLIVSFVAILVKFILLYFLFLYLGNAIVDIMQMNFLSDISFKF
jgi:membrane protein YqaA with SNARE-associated domain